MRALGPASLAAALLFSLQADAKTPKVPRFQLVGFTTATFTGGQGVLGFTLACQQQFANSRMCTSLEILETTKVPAGLAGEAWVRPSFAPGANNVMDASGISSDGLGLTCFGWSLGLNGISGLVVDGAGRFHTSVFQSLSYCDSARAVACCALVP